MRLVYFALDRLETQFVARECATGMSWPPKRHKNRCVLNMMCIRLAETYNSGGDIKTNIVTSCVNLRLRRIFYRCDGVDETLMDCGRSTMVVLDGLGVARATRLGLKASRHCCGQQRLVKVVET